MRKNEHPGCSCPACKRGKRSRSGHIVQRLVTKRIRRSYRQALKTQDDVMVAVPSPFMD